MIDKLKSWIVDVWSWGIEKPYRHWIFHFIFAFALSFVFGAWAMFVFFLLMGLQDTILDFAFHHPADFKAELIHKIGDVVAPAVAAGIAHVFFGK